MAPAARNAAPCRSPSLSTGFVLLWLFLAAFPFLWTVWGSFKVEADFFSRDRLAERDLRRRAPSRRPAAPSPATATTAPGSTQRLLVVGRSTPRSSPSSVVVISLTFGTLGGYALARSGYRYTFWILIAALVFRAMPHVTLVSGYLLPFFELNIWGYPADHDHRAGRDQPALHALDAALVLPVDPEGSRRERDGRRLHRASRRSAWWSSR